jgi:hypothetical protein
MNKIAAIFSAKIQNKSEFSWPNDIIDLEKMIYKRLIANYSRLNAPYLKHLSSCAHCVAQNTNEYYFLLLIFMQHEGLHSSISKIIDNHEM